MKSKVGGTVKDGRWYFLAAIRIPRSGKSIGGKDRVVGIFSSSDFFPPSGSGSETTSLSLLNWYRKELSLLVKREVALQISHSQMHRVIAGVTCVKRLNFTVMNTYDSRKSFSGKAGKVRSERPLLLLNAAR